MTQTDILLKRGFDLVGSAIGLLLSWPVIIICCVIASRDSGASGIFTQMRVGQNGKLFRIYKIRTMYNVAGTSVTTSNDARITRSGAILRRYKLDELPQLWNVFIGTMSLVGPRPDAPGFADRLVGVDRRILLLKPGITGPATLKYRNEEEILSKQVDPEAYNRDIIWPDKVAINRDYIDNYSLITDIRIIFRTVIKR